MSSIGVSAENMSLPIIMCLFLDIPDTRRYCYPVDRAKETRDLECVECPVPGKFLNGLPLHQAGSSGLVVLYIVSVISGVLGIIGILTNIFIIYVIRQRKDKKYLDTLYTALAWVDAIYCGSVGVSVLGEVILFGNQTSGPTTMYCILFLSHIVAFLKTTSNFITVTISLLQCFGVSHPLQVKTRMTIRRSERAVTICLLLAFLLRLPSMFAVVVAKNGGFNDDVSYVNRFSHLIISTKLGHSGNLLDLVELLITLSLVTAAAVLFHVNLEKWTVERTRIVDGQYQPKLPQKIMFRPVIYLLLLTSIFPLIFHIVSVLAAVAYRELYVLANLSNIIFCAGKLPIYIRKGTKFSREAWQLLENCFPKLTRTAEESSL